MEKKKQYGIRKGTQKDSQECFSLRRTLSLRVYRERFLSRLLSHLLCCCTGQEKSAHGVQVQLNTFFNHPSPKEHRHHAAMATFRPEPSQGRVCRFCKASRALPSPLCMVQTRLPQQMTAPFWSTSSTAADISAGCKYLVQFSPKSYEFWNTVTLQPWPRISTAFPKRYARCAKKHLQSISLWYLLCKIKAQGGKKTKTKQFLFCYSLVYVSSQL